MNYYEIVYVVNPNHSKDQVPEIIGEVSKHIESKKHAVVDHNFWEKKQLAYPVNKHKYGNYILLIRKHQLIYLRCGRAASTPRKLEHAVQAKPPA